MQVKQTTYRRHSQTELTHGVQSGRTSVQNLLDELRDSGTGCPILGQLCDLLLGGNFTGDQEPEEGFWERLVSTWGFGEERLAFWD